MSKWSGFLGKFGAKMKGTMKKKLSSNISEVRKKTDLLSVFSFINSWHQNYYKNISPEKKDGLNK